MFVTSPSLIQTLTSEARVLNPEACWVQGRSSGGGCGGQNLPPFVFSLIDNSWPTFFQNFISFHICMADSECNERLKNQSSDFYFLRYSRFCTQNWSVLR